MTLGIVGSEAAKFTSASEARVREAIREQLRLLPAWSKVVSGGCHLGGVDVYAIEEAKKFMCFEIEEFLPPVLAWEGYKHRNILIADVSDVVLCFTVDRLPASYSGMRFSKCYHCNTSDHVKSGGCWTVKYARKLGKVGDIIVVPQE